MLQLKWTYWTFLCAAFELYFRRIFWEWLCKKSYAKAVLAMLPFINGWAKLGFLWGKQRLHFASWVCTQTTTTTGCPKISHHFFNVQIYSERSKVSKEEKNLMNVNAELKPLRKFINNLFTVCNDQSLAQGSPISAFINNRYLFSIMIFKVLVPKFYRLWLRSILKIFLPKKERNN